MPDTKNLLGPEAIEKVKDLADGKICLLCTHDHEGIASRPMSTQGIDDDGTMWFFSPKDSEKNSQIAEDSTVYLMYMDTGKEHYLSLTGTAAVVKDRKKIDELWSGFAKAWFKEGKDDPQLTLIRVRPTEGHYWDTKGGKLVSLISIAVAAISGHRDDSGIEGDITV